MITVNQEVGILIDLENLGTKRKSSADLKTTQH